MLQSSRAVPFFIFFTVIVSLGSYAQTVVVDITAAHSTNRFIPNQTLGAGVDRIPAAAFDVDLVQPNLGRALESGWQPITYRQNTELAVEAWHWNPQGTWSDPAGKGYFTGSTDLGEPIRYSYGYGLPRRGFTRNDGTDNSGYSRLTDGDTSTFWKSNPYLTQHFTGESDATHPQWVVIDLAQVQQLNAIRIAWGEPYATNYTIQYWTGEDPIHTQTKGVWQTFPQGIVTDGKGGVATIVFNPTALPARYLRILMTASSNTCDADGPSDPRNCVGYAIREIYAGTVTQDGAFHDVMRHTPDQEQTTTYCSSVDPWHETSNIGSTKQTQVGFDFFYTSGVTRGLPAMIPVAMLYDTPDNAAAEVAYIEKRGYPISYVEMGEEADGQYALPEDYAELYIQWAVAIHKVDPNIKLGGPSFQGVNKDIEVWPDENGKVSWLGRFLDYLRRRGHLNDLAFFSFEHYPYDPCRIPWGSLYDEPELMHHIMQTWREDGLPPNLPIFITEGNLSSATSETYMDLFSAVWLADYVGSFLNEGGNALYFFHYLPLQMEHGCNDSPGTFGLFTVDAHYQIQQELGQFFTSQIINLEWMQPGKGEHLMFPTESDVEDGAGHSLITAYALKRPDGEWSVMLVNRDQETSHNIKISFDDDVTDSSKWFTGPVSISTFGSGQYAWHPAKTRFMQHAENSAERAVVVTAEGNADPDGPIAHAQQKANKDTKFGIPPASVVVIRGKIAGE